MKKVFGYIYLIVNCLNDMEYVGQTTKTVDERFKEHCKKRRRNMYIDNVIRAYGRENFLVITLKECNSQEELNKWERWFSFAKGCKCPFGYNIKDGGNNGHVSQETKDKISVALSGENHPNYGKPAPNRKYCPYQNLLMSLEAVGIVIYADIATLMNLSLWATKDRMHGEVPFTDEQKTFLADYLKKPVKYLFARDDGKSFEAKSRRGYCPYENLLAELKSVGIVTSADIATLMNLSIWAIKSRMHGKTPFTDKEKTFLADYLKKPVEYLFARTDGKSSKAEPRKRRGRPSPKHSKTSKNYGKPAHNRGYCPYKNLLAAMAKCGIVMYIELAEAIEDSPNNFCRKMQGIRNFTVEDKAKLAEFLDEPIEYLFVRDDGKSVVSDCGRCPYKNLEAEMAIRKISRRMLAKLLEMPLSTFSDRIKGRGEFTDEQKAFLSDYLDKPIEYLLARDDAE